MPPEIAGGTEGLWTLPLEEDGFELAVPSRRERLWAATPGKHCRFGPEPVGGSAFRAAVSGTSALDQLVWPLGR
jgi:hypothetical protein